MKAVLFIGLVLIAYRMGWESAHKTVASECRRLGSFYVGSSTFKCIEITQEHNK
jgi:hypothetical protein